MFCFLETTVLRFALLPYYWRFTELERMKVWVNQGGTQWLTDFNMMNSLILHNLISSITETSGWCLVCRSGFVSRNLICPQLAEIILFYKSFLKNFETNQGFKVLELSMTCQERGHLLQKFNQLFRHVNPFVPNALFLYPWKHQKTVKFSYVFRK